MQTLVLITAGFPYKKSEPFLHNEFDALCKKFNRIILIPVNPVGNYNFSLPDHVTVFPAHLRKIHFTKIIGLFIRHLPLLLIEASNIKNKLHQRLNWNHFKVSVIYLIRALKILYFLNKKIQFNKNFLIYSYWNDYSALAAGIKASKEKLPSLSRAHGWDVYFERHLNNYLPFKNITAQLLKRIYFVSQDGCQYSIKKYGQDLPKEKFQVSYLGTPYHQNSNPFSLQNKISLISCSSLIPLKQVDRIIEALSKIDTLEIQWQHVGEGPLLNDLKDLAAKKIRKKNNIHYEFLGYLNHEALFQLYRDVTVDLFINSSSTEGLPVSIMEAMSYGIPVIAPNIGGIRELVQPQQSGWLLSQKVQADEIAAAILAYAELPYAVKTSLRTTSRKTWEQNFNAKKNYKAFVEAIHAL